MVPRSNDPYVNLADKESRGGGGRGRCHRTIDGPISLIHDVILKNVFAVVIMELAKSRELWCRPNDRMRPPCQNQFGRPQERTRTGCTSIPAFQVHLVIFGRVASRDGKWRYLTQARNNVAPRKAR